MSWFSLGLLSEVVKGTKRTINLLTSGGEHNELYITVCVKQIQGCNIKRK